MPVLEPRQPSVPLPPQPAGVPWPGTEWPTGGLASEQAAGLDELLDRAFPPAADTVHADPVAGSQGPFGLSLAFVAIKGGRLVAERYGPTAGPDEALISWSMAKSFTQALIGVLVADGRLGVEDTAVLEAWSDPEDPRSAITVDHLLRMVPGTQFNEDYVDAETSHCIEMLFGSGNPDMSGYAAALPAIAPPNTVFNYSSGTSVLLCRILADRVGRGDAFEAWMREVLLDPIGLTARLTFDDAGVWVGSSFLHATARDFARFGLLYLRDGIWDGRRLLPEGWADYARTRQATNDEGGAYGAHWWIWPQDHDVFFASGYETQRIIVDPANDLVLVRLGKTPVEQAPAVDAWLEEIRLVLAG